LGCANLDGYGPYWQGAGVPAGIGQTMGHAVTTYRSKNQLRKIPQVKEDVLSGLQSGPLKHVLQDDGIVMLYDEQTPR
jgi:hypothetical protein